VKLYVEGGGDSKALKTKCREGFRSFLEKTGFAGRMPRVIACGGRSKAFDMFCHALASSTEEAFIVLLVDSEGPVADGAEPWRHLSGRDGWKKPPEATDEQAHLMVECMEAWFLADPDSLADYFGPGFDRKALPRRQEIERVAKKAVLRGLRKATHGCAKGGYCKGRHSFEILSRIDPAKIFDKSPYARRLIDALRKKAVR